LALVSLIVGRTALFSGLGLYVMARWAPQLLTPVAILDWGRILFAVLAIRWGRQAVGRITNTSDKRGLMMAQAGPTLGWATVAYAAISFVVWPLVHVASNIEP
jgi:hypothetical protein